MYLPSTLAAIFAAKLIAEGKPVPAYVGALDHDATEHLADEDFDPCAACGMVFNDYDGELPVRSREWLRPMHRDCVATIRRYGCD